MSLRRLLGAAVATAAITAITAAPPAARAQHPTQAGTGAVRLVLQSQTFTVAPGDPWTVTYLVEGDLGLDPPPTTTTTTTTTTASTTTSTSTPTTTTPTTGVTATTNPATATTARATTTTARATTTTVPDTADPPELWARINAHPRIDHPDELAGALDRSADAVLSRMVVPATIGTSDAGPTLTFDVPTTPDPDAGNALLLSRAGLYPITVELVADEAIVARHRTFLERRPAVPDDLPPVNLAVLTDVEDPGPAADPAARSATRAAIRAVTTAAAALDGALTVRLPPVPVEQLPRSTRDDLTAALDGGEVLATPRLALDPSPAVAAGTGTTFSAELRAGEDALGAALPDHPPVRSAWLVPDTGLSAAAGAMLREPLGFDLLVFGQDTYNQLEGGIGGFHDPTLAFDVVLGDDNTLPGMVVSPLSRWLDPDELARRRMSPADAAIVLFAELTTWRRAYGDELRRSVILEVAPDRADPAILTALADHVAVTPSFRLTTLSTLATATDTMDVPGTGREVVTLPAAAGMDLTARVERINLTRLHADGAASMLTDPTRGDEWDAQLDELLSTSLDDDYVDAQLDRISAQAQEIYDRVEAPRPFTFTLTGRTSTLRLNLTNHGDEDLQVILHPTSPKLTFPDGDEPYTLAANAVTEVVLQVEARTNGTSSIAIEVLTPANGLNVEGPIVLTARVNALSGMGQVVTGAALLILLSWWYQHFRRRRRERRAAIGEVDNPPMVETDISPDAAEATVPAPPSDSVSEP